MESEKQIYVSNHTFTVKKSVDTSPYTSKNYILHTHSFDEICIFLSGDASFIIEGVYYTNLKPYDILLIKRNEFHYVKHSSANKPFDRITLSIKDKFYTNNNCETFSNVFLKKPRGTNNLIPAETVKKTDILDNILRLAKRLKEKDEYSELLLNCAIIELLYSINRLNSPKTDYKNNIIKQIIDCINDNIKGRLTLDDIANHFFISKCHLCRIFKNTTGLTITQYITFRRIDITEEFCKKGKSITDACLEAGFGSYTNFYKAYTKEKGINPRIGINTKI